MSEADRDERDVMQEEISLLRAENEQMAHLLHQAFWFLVHGLGEERRGWAQRIDQWLQAHPRQTNRQKSSPF